MFVCSFPTEMIRQICQLTFYSDLLECLKLALRVEIKAWKLLFGKELNNTYSQKMEEILSFIDDYSKCLSRPIRDLEDVRQAMAALSVIRENQIQMDMSLAPIEVIKSPNQWEVHILIMVQIWLVSAWHFLVCTISCEPMIGFFTNFHGYIIGT